MKRIIFRLLPPILFLLLLGLLHVFWGLLGLPAEQNLPPLVQELFEKFGILLVAGVALVEGLFVIGWYFPGSTIIVLCLLVASKSTSSLLSTGCAAAIGLLVAHLFNYLIGRHGWYHVLEKAGMRTALDKAKSRLTRYGLPAIFLTYWQPNVASAVSTAAGVLAYPFLRFLLFSTFSIIFWTIVWVSAIGAVGAAAMSIVSIRVIIAVGLLWLMGALSFTVYRYYRNTSGKETES